MKCQGQRWGEKIERMRERGEREKREDKRQKRVAIFILHSLNSEINSRV